MRQKDLFVSCCWLLCGTLCLAAVHDELPQCGLQGVYRQRQSLIESPNYPDNYPPNSCVDYVIRSPYRCPTKFHIQFLDFQLELSENCSRDYLAIGLQNADDDMAVLCGQVLGIRKYHTPDGILRLRFLSDDSPWTTNGGFRLLITRLACEREDLAARGLEVEDDEDEQDDTVEVNAKLPHKKPLHHHQQPPQQQLLQFPQNFSLPGQQQTTLFGTPWPPLYPSLQPYPVVGYPPYAGGGFAGSGFYLPVAPQQASAAGPPCNPNEPQQQQHQQQQHLQQQQLQQQQLQQLQQQLQQQQQQQLQQQQQQLQQQQFQQQLPAISDQYQTSAFQPQGVNLKDYDPQSLQQFGGQVDLCCVSSFNQAHFYLSSPGFPRTVLNVLLPSQQRDCVFYLEKNSPNVAGLRIQFKFFDFGQSSAAGGGIYPGQSSAAGGIYPGQSSAAGGGLFTGQAGGVRGGCNGDFIELDGQRYCGCRSGHVHKSFWPEGRKALRLRMGQSGGAASNGFLLEIFQDQDTESYRLDGGAIGGAFNQGGQGLLGNTGLPGLTGLAGLPGLGGLQGLNGYQPQLGPQLGLQPQLGYRPQPQAPLWPNYLPHPATALPNYPLAPPQQLLPFTPYRQSRQASWQYARGLDAQQPARVVETNSTRKEFYYFDADEAFARAALDDEDIGSRTTTTGTTTSSPGTISVSQNPNTKAFEQSSCSFDYMEVLRLTVDTLWLTKPICFAPVRSWFSNIFG